VFIYNCKASNGANFHYNSETGSNGKKEAGAGDQGTYFKGRILGDNQHLYVINCTASGGSIIEQLSFPEGNTSGNDMPHNTGSLTANCDFRNAAQDLVHFEDAYVNIIYNSKIGCDNDGNFYQPRIWVSNRTGIFYSQNTDFYNATIHFGARASMKLAMINGGNFTSAINYSSQMMDGADIVANASFSGAKIKAFYVNKSSFKGVSGAIGSYKSIVNCSFDNSNTGKNTTTSVLDIFNSSIAIADDKGKALGFLTAALGNSGTNNGGGGDTSHHDTTTTTTKGDTVIITKYVHDTVRVYIHDTTKTYQHDTVRYSIHDTVKIYLHDTVTISIPAHDTIYITTPVHDTVNIATIIHDTLRFTTALHDTLYKHDTLKLYNTIHDTLCVNIPYYIHDTVYVKTDGTGGSTGGNTGGGGNPTKTQVGLLPWQHAQSIGLPIGRGRIVVSTGSGVASARGILISPSVVWIAKEFPKDLAAYESKLRSAAAKMTKENTPYIQLENEPNYGETNGDLETYIKMVKIATAIFEPKGIEVYSGGLTFNALAAYCAALYSKEGDSKSWQVFRDNKMTIANNDSYDWISGYMSRVASEGLHINFNFHCHIDDQTLAVLPLVVAKLKQVVKGKILAGEISFDKQNADWVTQALTILKPVDAVLLYSEENGGTTAVRFTSEMDKAAQAFK
jgi:hypothetical protein